VAYKAKTTGAKTNYDLFKKEIKEKKFRNVYVFYGEEDYLINYYKNLLCNELLSKDTKDLNLVLLDENTDVNNLLSNVNSMPFFSDNKVVIVRDSKIFNKGENFPDRLKEYIENPLSSTYLIFIESKVKSNSKGLNLVNKYNGLAVNFEYRPHVELENWANRVFKDRGKEPESGLVEYFISICNDSMYSILNEIDKISMYKGEEKRITRKDIDTICTLSTKAIIFDMTDAMADGNSSKALNSLDKLIAAKEEIIVIIASLSSHMYKLLKVKGLLQKRMSNDLIASKMAASPYYIRNLAKQCGRISIDKLKFAVEKCHEIDLNSKTGGNGGRLGLELFICEFTAK